MKLLITVDPQISHSSGRCPCPWQRVGGLFHPILGFSEGTHFLDNTLLTLLASLKTLWGVVFPSFVPCQSWEGAVAWCRVENNEEDHAVCACSHVGKQLRMYSAVGAFSRLCAG